MPAFVSVHDPSYKAYIVIQEKHINCFIARFDKDIGGSEAPGRLMRVERLYELLVVRFVRILVS